jgi:hypothetical protein
MRQGNDKFLQPGTKKPTTKPAMAPKGPALVGKIVGITGSKPKPTAKPKPGVGKNPNKFKVI